MPDTNIYFSDFFEVSPESLEEHGSFNVSLVNDLPLFVDPFLLFNSDNKQYQLLHDEIIKYMRFLKVISAANNIPEALLKAWFTFPEVSQNWLGFSTEGNQGHGLGIEFAIALNKNLNTIFSNFGEETVTKSSHLEKLCLIKNGVGRDNVSDFTTNLIKDFLCNYTQKYAINNVNAKFRRNIQVPKAFFNYTTKSWVTKAYELPFINGDYVLLTPKDILTKDDTWINRPDLLNNVEDIAEALPNDVLRVQVSRYLVEVLPRGPKAKRDEINDALSRVIEKYPDILDYYIRNKEDNGQKAESLSKERVAYVQAIFVDQIRQLVDEYLEPIGFYKFGRNTYEEARERLLFLKDVVENKGGHRYIYIDGKPMGRESDLHILYRLTWFASSSNVSREVNDGRGPVDFMISRGSKDKTLVEFKLATNPQLEKNLAKQVEIYEAASDPTHPSLKAIFYFYDKELERVIGILGRLGLTNNPHIILIDARADNKPSGSKA